MDCEAEILPGLKPFALDELRSRFRHAIDIYPGSEPDAIRFCFTDDPCRLFALRMVIAIHRVEHFAIPRPRALLGHEHFTRLADALNQVLKLHPPGTFHTFRISAAGKESSVFNRLADEIATCTGLVYTPDEAELLLRVRPSSFRQEGWDVLIRLSPRPLSVRGWRVCDMPGALNATIAAAMVELTQPGSRDRFLNLMCGSGTLLIERLLRRTAARAIGCDTDDKALACASENLVAAGVGNMAELVNMDTTRLDFSDGTFDAICVDLPWGQLVGSYSRNVELYPAVLREAARVAAPGARLVAITHNIRLFETLLPEFARFWEVQNTIRVFQGGLHPRIYVLRRL